VVSVVCSCWIGNNVFIRLKNIVIGKSKSGMISLNQLLVVIASPNDVRKEREGLDRTIQKVNRHIAKPLGLSLQAVRWETDTYPGFHADGPQALIDSLLNIEDCDILIGIFCAIYLLKIRI
jgi:hypothetical protein